jgi:hypothetical protein
LNGEIAPIRQELARLAKEHATAENQRQQAELRARLARVEQEKKQNEALAEAARLSKARLEEETRKRAAETEALRRQAEADRARFAAAPAPKLTLAQAKAEAEKLEKQIEEVSKRNAAELEQALARLAANLKAEQDAVTRAMEWNQFQTTAQNNERLAKAKQREEEFKVRVASQQQAIRASYAEREAAEKTPLEQWLNSVRAVPYLAADAALGEFTYDADTERLAVRAGGAGPRYVSLPVEDAKLVHDGWKSARVERALNGDHYLVTREGRRIPLPEPDHWINPQNGIPYLRVTAGSYSCAPFYENCAVSRVKVVAQGFWIAVIGYSDYLRFQKTPPTFTFEEGGRYCADTGGRLPTEGELLRAGPLVDLGSFGGGKSTYWGWTMDSRSFADRVFSKALPVAYRGWSRESLEPSVKNILACVVPR